MAGKFCPKTDCGAENNEHASFCRRCGTRLGEAAPPFRPGNAPGQVAGAKDKTMVDPNLSGGPGRQGQVIPQPNVVPAQPMARPGKGRTVVDNAQPGGGGVPADRGRKLVGFLVTYDHDSGHMGTFYPLYQGRAKLGAYVEPEGNILIDRSRDGGVSETHCVLLHRNGRLSVADEMSSNGTWVDVATANQTKYPDLYHHQGAATVKTGSFDEREISFINIEDSKVELTDGSFLKVGNSVFQVKLVG